MLGAALVPLKRKECGVPGRRRSLGCRHDSEPNRGGTYDYQKHAKRGENDKKSRVEREKWGVLQGKESGQDSLTEDSGTFVDITANGIDYFLYPNLRHIGEDVDDICVNHEHILYAQAFSTLDELRRDGLLCDVELSVGDHRTIAAHRVVLAAVIPYFHAMFTVEMIESTKKKITIRNIDFATLELIVSYAYCGRLHINVENVLPVMYAANFLQLNALTEKCANYLKHHMHLTNVLGVRAVCSSLNCSSAETERFVEKYFTSICLTKSFLELSIDELTMLLAKDSLNVENEETVCKAALRWIDHDPTHRKVFISRCYLGILKCLRLLALNPSFLVVELGRHPLVREDKQGREILDEVKDYLLVPNLERSTQPPFSAEPRHCGDLPCLIYAI
ncbi:BTB/POZ domain protein, partial [Ancylostoma duodenale]